MTSARAGTPDRPGYNVKEYATWEPVTTLAQRCQTLIDDYEKENSQNVTTAGVGAFSNTAPPELPDSVLEAGPVNVMQDGPGLIGLEPTKAAGEAVVWKILWFRTKFAMGRHVHGTVQTGSFGTLNP